MGVVHQHIRIADAARRGSEAIGAGYCIDPALHQLIPGHEHSNVPDVLATGFRTNHP